MLHTHHCFLERGRHHTMDRNPRTGTITCPDLFCNEKFINFNDFRTHFQDTHPGVLTKYSQVNRAKYLQGLIDNPPSSSDDEDEEDEEDADVSPRSPSPGTRSLFGSPLPVHHHTPGAFGTMPGHIGARHSPSPRGRGRSSVVPSPRSARSVHGSPSLGPIRTPPRSVSRHSPYPESSVLFSPNDLGVGTPPASSTAPSPLRMRPLRLFPTPSTPASPVLNTDGVVVLNSSSEGSRSDHGDDMDVDPEESGSAMAGSPSTTIRLNPDVNYLRPILFLPNLVVHTALRILICLKCGHTVLPSAAWGHANDHVHGTKLPQCKAELDDLIESSKLCQSAVEIPYVAPFGPPVQGITIKKDAFACSECDYVGGRHGSFKNHVTACHNGTPAAQCLMRVDHYQNIHPNPSRHFFAVDTFLKSRDQTKLSDLVTRYIVEPSADPNIVLAADTENDVHRWDDMTGWSKLFIEERKTQDGIKKLRDLTWIPGYQDKTSSPLRNLRDVVYNYLIHAGTLARQADLGVRRLMEQCPP